MGEGARTFDRKPQRAAAHPARSSPLPIQAKLRIEGPDSPGERAADRMAGAFGGLPSANARSASVPEVTADVQARVLAMRGGGHSLPAAERSFFESRFGTDFSQVRVHADAAGAQAASALRANAFTVGHDIGFAEGRYSPVTDRGRQLLAHELTHVVQQRSAQGSPVAVLQREPADHIALQGVGTDEDKLKEVLKGKTKGPAKREDKPPAKPSPAKPDAGAKPGDKKPAPACPGPLDMRAITSGGFLDKLDMANYYPELAGKGYWKHGDTGGPWDNGDRCGVNVQLVGTLDPACSADDYQFKQTITHNKSIIDGKPDSDHGTTQDDIAKSGGDYTKPPRRHQNLDGRTLHISMADPPSLQYSKVKSAEWDRTFVTTLAGPAGSKSVTWYASILVDNGKVERNTVK